MMTKLFEVMRPLEPLMPGTAIMLLGWLFQIAGWAVGLWDWHWFVFAGSWVVGHAINYQHYIRTHPDA